MPILKDNYNNMNIRVVCTNGDQVDGLCLIDNRDTISGAEETDATGIEVKETNVPAGRVRRYFIPRSQIEDVQIL